MNVVSLSQLLFVETRVRALPVELRKMFPAVGIPAVYGGEEKQPFDVVRTGNAGMEAEDALWFMLHIGLPEETDVGAQSRFKIGEDVVKAIRDFAARRGWVLAAHRNGMDFSPAHFTYQISILPDKQQAMEEMPPYLYHITENIESIRREGLKPRHMTSQRRNYPGRVYVFSDTKLMRDMIEQSINAHDEKARTGSSFYQPLTKTPDISIIKINTAKLRRGTKFFVDPEFDGHPGALYTYTHIPAEAIASIQPTGY